MPDAQISAADDRTTGRPVAFRSLCIGLGLLLLAAAASKFQSTTWDPLGSAFVLSPHVRLALIEMEAAVGVWLILGAAPRLLRLAAMAYFGLLAAVSLWLGVRGVPSCGCFGSMAVNPWVTFGIEIVAIVALAWARPRVTQDIAPPLARPFLIHTLTLALGASAVIAVLAVAAVAQYGSVTAALVALRAEALSVEPRITDIGDGPAGG